MICRCTVWSLILSRDNTPSWFSRDLYLARCNQRRELGKTFDKTPEIQNEMGEFSIPVRVTPPRGKKISKCTFLGDMSRIWRRFVKIINSAKLVSLWRIWLKFAKIVKSINIHSVWRDFDKRNTVGILAQNKTFCDQNCLRTQPSLDRDSRYGN